ncbi:hypothetical protein PMEGAPL125_49870 [Priestia megaterium]
MRLNQWRKPHYIKATSCRTIKRIIRNTKAYLFVDKLLYVDSGNFSLDNTLTLIVFLLPTSHINYKYHR